MKTDECKTNRSANVKLILSMVITLIAVLGMLYAVFADRNTIVGRIETSEKAIQDMKSNTKVLDEIKYNMMDLKKEKGQSWIPYKDIPLAYRTNDGNEK